MLHINCNIFGFSYISQHLFPQFYSFSEMFCTCFFLLLHTSLQSIPVWRMFSCQWHCFHQHYRNLIWLSYHGSRTLAEHASQDTCMFYITGSSLLTSFVFAMKYISSYRIICIITSNRENICVDTYL